MAEDTCLICGVRPAVGSSGLCKGCERTVKAFGRKIVGPDYSWSEITFDPEEYIESPGQSQEREPRNSLLDLFNKLWRRK